MQPTMCSRCGKNVAIVFITKIENGQTKNEGLCLKCARELHIKPVDDVINKMGISDEDLDSITGDMMNALSGVEDMMDVDNDGSDDSEDDGKTATFPFLNRLFGGPPTPPAQGDGGNAVPPELTDADDGSYYSSIGGVQSFWAVHTDNHGFRYIVVMDAEEMLHDSNMLLLRSCIGAGLVLLIILVAGYAIAGSAVLPLARLESAANAIADGRPDATFPDASEFSGEIRGLRNAMARMLLSQRAALSAAQRAAQQASANEHYALAALRDVSRRHGDCRNKLEALRLAAHDLSAAVENLPDAVDDEDRARRVKEALKASRWFMALAGNSCREEGAPGEPPADAGTSARE